MEIIIFVVALATYGAGIRYFTLLFSLGSRSYRSVLSSGNSLLNSDPRCNRYFDSISVN
jgi:hypothetical protein